MTPEGTTLVGIDCATVDAKIGLAMAVLRNGCLHVREATLCGRERLASSVIGGWLSDRTGPALLAIDAPLGWPKPLAETLMKHRAGEAINTSANAMFRRTTDIFIHRELGKTPLDVGADRIARTAHAALRLLGVVRARLGLPIPLAWAPNDVADVTAIEVYPAATLIAHRLRSTGYKQRKQLAARREIVAELRRWLVIPETITDLGQSPDLVDAAVCLVAGNDFLQGRAMSPGEEDQALIRREGWIWASKRDAGQRVLE